MLPEARHTRDESSEGQCGKPVPFQGDERSKGADRKEPQIKLGVLSLLPELLQGEIQATAQGFILGPGDEADALAEEAALQVRSAGEVAAAASLLSPDPKGETETVGEQVVDLAGLEGGLSGGQLREGLEIAARHEGLGEGLM